MGQSDGAFQRISEFGLPLFIDLRLTCLIDEEIARLGIAKQFCNAGIATGRVTKPAPHALPLPIAVQQQIARAPGAIRIGVKSEVTGTDVPEGLPARRVASPSKRFGFRHPTEK